MRILSVALFFLLAGCERRRPFRPVAPPEGYEVRGIDVSHHQGRIDWERVGASGDVRFVFVKATEGTTHVDRRFRSNWRGAHDQGLRVGAYHYLSLCRTGAAQAQHFVKTVPVVQGMLPPVVDIEPDARCNRGSRLASMGTAVKEWVDVVEAHYGVRPIVYTSSSFQRTHLAREGIASSLWLAAYSRPPRHGDWAFWQYTDRGRVPGIDGPVDGNVFGGSHAALEALRR